MGKLLSEVALDGAFWEALIHDDSVNLSGKNTHVVQAKLTVCSTTCWLRS